MRVLLLGTTGFIGAAIARALLAAGHHVSAGGRGPLPDLPHLRDLAPRLQAVRADLDDPDSLLAAARGHEALVCAALRADHADDPRWQAATQAIHLGWAARRARLRRLILLGSAVTCGAVVGQAATELDLYASGDPADPVTAALYAAEAELLAANSATLYAMALLPTTVIGPGDFREEHRSLLRGLLLRPPAALPDLPLNLVDVRDVARSVQAALAQGRPGQRYLLPGRTTTLGALARRLHDHHGGPPIPLHPPPPSRLSRAQLDRALGASRRAPTPQALTRLLDVPVEIDRTKARVELGHTTRNLDASIADAVAWIRENTRSTA